MLISISSYHTARPSHLYGLMALLASTWLAIGSQPIIALSISTILIMLYLITVYTACSKLTAQKNKIIGQLKIESRDIIQNIASNIKDEQDDGTSFKAMMSMLFKKYYMPQDVPFFFMIGENNDSKKQHTLLLKNAGFKSIDNTDLLEPQTCSLDQHCFTWWFTNKGVIVDLSSHNGNDQIVNLMALLNQFGEQPLKGLIYGLDGQLLAPENEPTLMSTINKLKLVTDNILAHTDCQLPYELLLQNGQSVEGFKDYMGSYIQAGNTAPLGVTFNDGQINSKLIELVDHLNSMIPSMLYSKDKTYSSLLVTKFPNSIDQMRQAIAGFGQNINLISEQLEFKGFYLSDCSFTKLNEVHAQDLNSQVFNTIINNFTQYTAPVTPQSYVPLLVSAVVLIAGLSELVFLYDRNYTNITNAKTRNTVAVSNGRDNDAKKVIRKLNRNTTSNNNTGKKQLGVLHRLLDFSVSHKIADTTSKKYHESVQIVLTRKLSTYINDDLKSFKSLSTDKQLKLMQVIQQIRDNRWHKQPGIYRYLKNRLLGHHRFNSKLDADLKRHYNYFAKNTQHIDIAIDNALLRSHLRAFQTQDFGEKLLATIYNKDKQQPDISVIDLIHKDLRKYLVNPQAFTIDFRYTHTGYLSFKRKLTRSIAAQTKHIEAANALNPENRVNLNKLQKNLLDQHIVEHIKRWKALFTSIELKQVRSRKTASIVLSLLSADKGLPVALKKLALENLPSDGKSITADFKKYLDKIKASPANNKRLKILAKKIKSRRNDGSSHRTAKAIKTTDKNVPEQLIYLRKLKRDILGMVKSKKRGTFASKWDRQVYSYCARNLKNRYPLNRNASRGIHLSHFKKYFGNNGKIVKFYNKELRKYLTIRSGKWVWNKKGKKLNVNKRFLIQIRTAFRIKQKLFHSNNIRLNFDIKPLYLDPKLDRVKLTVGAATSLYSHGAPSYINIQWPPKNNISNVHYTFFKPNGKTITGSFRKGHWTWVQIMDNTLRKKKGLLTFRRGNYKALYRVKRSKNLMSKLKLISQYRCVRP